MAVKGRKPKTRYQTRKKAGHQPASMEFPSDLYEALKKYSDKDKRSAAEITRRAVQDYLYKHGAWPEPSE